MPESGLEGENEDRTIPAEHFKQKEDLKAYGQLPDYDEFQRYDRGADSELSQNDGEIYSNFHKPSREKLRRHLFLAGSPWQL